MDKSVTKSVQLLVKILDNTTTIYMYMLFGSLGCYPKDHTKSMQIRLAPNLYNKIRLLSTYLPTNIQLVKCTHLCRVAAATFLSSPVSLRRQSNFRHDGTNLV